MGLQLSHTHLAHENGQSTTDYNGLNASSIENQPVLDAAANSFPNCDRVRTALYEISRAASAIEVTLEGYGVIHYVLIRLPDEIYPIFCKWMSDAFHPSNPVSRIESGSIIDALSITKEYAKRNRSGSLTIPPTNTESTIRTINNS